MNKLNERSKEQGSIMYKHDQVLDSSSVFNEVITAFLITRIGLS